MVLASAVLVSPAITAPARATIGVDEYDVEAPSVDFDVPDVDVNESLLDLVARARTCAYTLKPTARITRLSGSGTITESGSLDARYNCGSFAANVTITDEVVTDSSLTKSATKTLSGSVRLVPATSQSVQYVLDLPVVDPLIRPYTKVTFVYRVGRSSSNYTLCFEHSYTIVAAAMPQDNGIHPMSPNDCND
jgi:hypothetical protein